MAKNTIGQFIAALRKANGMTQQEVADRLNVSNKAVSRWERDECAPDISLLPAIAEMFGITCDELLRGERLSSVAATEPKKPKAEKQIKALVERTVSGFRTMIYISVAVSLIGLVCMFGISYGFYRPVIGFSIMLLFEICACAITVLGITKSKDVRKNELFGEIGKPMSDEFDKTLGNYSFIALFEIFSVILLSLPLLMTGSFSVMTLQSYFGSFFIIIAFILFFVFFRFRKIICDWITENSKPRLKLGFHKEKSSVISTVQIILTAVAGVLFVVAPYFATKPDKDILLTAVVILGILCLVANVVCFVLFFFRNKEERKNFILNGIRNILLIPSTFIASECHYIGWTYHDAEGVMLNPEKYDVWQSEYLFLAIGYTCAIFMIFSLINMRRKKHTD